LDAAHRLVVFDCDGTLVDSQHIVVEGARSTFRAFGLAPPTPAAVRRVVGLSLVEAVAALHPEGSADEQARLVRDLRAAFADGRRRPDSQAALFPGAVEAIDALGEAGCLLGVATGMSRRGLHDTLDRFSLRDRFVTLQSADDAPSKPHPGMLRHAMAEAGVGPDETVLVGDTTYDMAMAVNAGVPAIGVTWGYHGAEELRPAGARVVVESFDELVRAIIGSES
jgi:phosphoglycolate phosphatase